MKKLIKIYLSQKRTSVILFTVTVLTGLAVKYYKQVISGNAGEHYDYSKSTVCSALFQEKLQIKVQSFQQKAVKMILQQIITCKKMIQSADLSVKRISFKDRSQFTEEFIGYNKYQYSFKGRADCPA